MWGEPIPGVCLTSGPAPHSDLCDLALLKPLWQLFTHMEYSLFEDVTSPGILLPLHRALTELFFVTENRAQVRVPPVLPPPPGWAGVACSHRSLLCPTPRNAACLVRPKSHGGRTALAQSLPGVCSRK